MDKKLRKDVVKWDVNNWARAIDYWNIEDCSGMKALGIGEGEGGLSLFFALKGADVVCSDYEWLGSYRCEAAKLLHKKYKVDDKIKYENVDATKIDYENEFDIIFFKSVLGGIGRNQHDEKIQTVFSEIYKALKPGGTLYFAENLKGNLVVRKLRKKYSKATKAGWNYLDEQKLVELKGDFTVIREKKFGCIACVGFNEHVRHFLSAIDFVVERIFRNNYIISGVYNKK